MSPTTITYTSTKALAPASSPFASPIKRKTMSITQTYFLAHKARAKLSSEAARPDHNLRLLVGHANMLDSLMLELADAEREQESWFNQSVRGASPAREERHIQWADTVVEEAVEDYDEDAESDVSDSDSDFDDDEDTEMADAVPLHRVASSTSLVSPITSDEEEYDEDEDEDYAKLSLTRSPSHSSAPLSPPELDHDSDSSEDESMPPSPPTALIPTFSSSDKKQQEAVVSEKSFYDDGYYLPPRNPARLVSAISVY